MGAALGPFAKDRMATYCCCHPLRWGVGRPLPQPFASHTSPYPPVPTDPRSSSPDQTQP